MRILNRLRGTSRLAVVFLMIICVSAVVSVVAEELVAGRLFGIQSMPLISVVLVGLIGVLAAWALVFALYPNIGRLVRADVEVVGIAALKGRKYLITGYSPLYDYRRKTEKLMPDLDKIRCVDLSYLCGPSDGARELLGNWQQNVRTISVLMERDGLDEVFVINPSIDQFKAFKKTIESIFPDCLQVTLVHSVDNPDIPYMPYKRCIADYEDFDYVYGSIKQAVKTVRQRHAARPSDNHNSIALDITPGQKPYSMAAAIATLNSDLLAVYVTSVGEIPDGQSFRLLAYDAEIEIGQSPI